MPAGIGLDLGTSKTTIVIGKTVVLNEPSVVSVETDTGEPIQYGQEAYKMIGRTPDRITPICPIERGVIANFDAAEQMLRHFMRCALGNKMVRPRVMVTAPNSVTAVQRRSLTDAAVSSGARIVDFIEAPVAAAIGIGIDFVKPHGTIVVDIGAGTIDVAVLSMGGLAQCESTKLGSRDFDDAIIRYVRREHNILIGARTAEHIKKHVGSVVHRSVDIVMKAKGRNLFTGLPEMFEITANDVCDATADVSFAICNSVQSVLEKTPPELVGDIATDGMYVTGGGSLIYGMQQMLSAYTGIPANLVSDPFTCVAKGAAKACEDPALLQNGDIEGRMLSDLEIQ